MLADLHDQRPGPDPPAGGSVRVKIVDGAVAGVPAVEGILSGTVGTLSHGLVKLTVVDAGEGPGLIDDL